MSDYFAFMATPYSDEDDDSDLGEGSSLLHTSHMSHRMVSSDEEMSKLYNHSSQSNQRKKSTTSDTDRPYSKRYKVLIAIWFGLISFGYMVPWTSLGSLISYFKYKYSANFYVKLYCCYYLPGLPVALLQYKYDVLLDHKYGSRNMYLFRGTIAFLGMILIISFLLRVENKYYLLFMFTGLGVCGWLCHGTATMLASMYPSFAIAALQTGFRCPEIFTIIAVSILHLGKNVDDKSLLIFFTATSFAVLSGLVGWMNIIFNETSAKCFEAKDNTLEYVYNEKKSFKDEAVITERKPLSSTANYDSTNGYVSLSVMRSDSSISLHHLPSSHTIPNQSEENTPIKGSKASTMMLLPDDISDKKDIVNKVFPLSVALYVTMFASIFQASFFAYVESSGSLEIEQVLYFIRLFADLVGRPLTRLPRPWVFKVRGSHCDDRILHGYNHTV